MKPLYAMQITAETLSRAPVILEWMQLLPDARGVCITTLEGIFKIGIQPGMDTPATYKTFLHEAAHAYINKRRLVYPDPEHAARALAGHWVEWTAGRRLPSNVIEFYACLQKLGKYHEVYTDDLQFITGANAGRIIPAVNTWRVTA